MSEKRVIHIEGARQHNLKNISIDIPRDQMVVICGPSGSGKSTLAFDIIYAEGQRRYVESLVGLRAASSCPRWTSRWWTRSRGSPRPSRWSSSRPHATRAPPWAR